MKESRIAREQQFFDKTFETDGRKAVHKFYKIIDSSRTFFENYLISHCANRHVLEYGCGKGIYAFMLANRAARVTGIDISGVAIELAQSKVREQGLANVDFFEQDAEAMEFEDSHFDLIFGTSILHHLHLERALKEIVRVLKPDGKAIFIEPLGHNPLINLYRRLTPRYRTADEHPLKMKDLKFIKNFFHQAYFKFYNFFSILAVPFRNTRIFPVLLKWLEGLDHLLFKLIPIARPLAWQVIIILEQPQKGGGISLEANHQCSIAFKSDYLSFSFCYQIQLA